MFGRSGWKTLGWAAALSLAACEGGTMPASQSHDFDATGFDGLESQKFAVLMNGDCTVDGTTGDMAITVRDAEVLYVYKRLTDSKIVTNALAAGGAECSTTATATRKIVVTGSAGVNKVLIDFLNGTFAPGVKGATPAANAPGIELNLAGGTDDVTIRGTTGVDTWTMGSDNATFASITFNSVDVTNDKVPDIELNAAETLKVSTGASNDVINGMGVLTSEAIHPFGLPLTAFGGAGNDTFTSGNEDVATSNVLNGGDGDDTFTQQNNLAQDQLVGGEGRDTVTYATRPATRGTMPAVAAPLTITVGSMANDGESGELDEVSSDVETVIGGAANDSIDADAGTSDDLTTVAATGIPIGTCYRLVGGAGSDTLIGSDFDDVLEGGDGDDVARGGTGNDTMTGGMGVDTVDYTGAATFVTVYLDGSDAGAAVVNGVAGEIDLFNRTTATADFENLRGSANNDVLHGNAGNNIVWGAAGNDTINGNDGADVIYGEAGTDTLNGGNGNDVVVGGAAVDTMSGGAGDDLMDALDGAATDVTNCGADNDAVVVDGAADMTANAQMAANAEYCELVN